MSQVTDRDTGEETLVAAADLYLQSLLCEVLDRSAESLDLETAFGELGINSFHVLKITKRLEVDFGRLPKTLLFEYITPKELGYYFASEHREIVLKISQNTERNISKRISPSIAEVDAKVDMRPIAKHNNQSSILSIHDLPNMPDLKRNVDSLYDKYKNEGSVSRGTSEIAPFIFLVGERRGYFNIGRKDDIVLAYSYTGENEYFYKATEELANYCKHNELKLNLMTDKAISVVGKISFSSTPFGVVQRIYNLSEFSLSGGKMRRLRYLISKFEKVGHVETKEYINGSDLDTDKAIVRLIDLWCADKGEVNPLVAVAKSEIAAGKLNDKHRLFTTYIDSQLVNVILITPISSPSPGYLMDLEFYPSDMPLGGLEYTIVNIIEKLVEEGQELFSMGATLGPKLEESTNADPALDGALDELRKRNIFDDQGNLQFKNKFRPENKSIFLCRPKYYRNADDIFDVIMMIADPGKMEPFPFFAEEKVEETLSDFQDPINAYSADLNFKSLNTLSSDVDFLKKVGQRGCQLIEAGFNVANIPAEAVPYDLKSDSWAKLSKNYSRDYVKQLYSNIRQPRQLDKLLEGLFGFQHVLVTKSGSFSESILCRAWPNRGLVYQNILFPTLIYSLLDNGFNPVEIPHPSIYDNNSPCVHRSEIDVEKLKQALDSSLGQISFVCIELTNNAAGGAPVSIEHLVDVKNILKEYDVPLVLDATRIIENAVNTITSIDKTTESSVWNRVREICSFADVVTASLAKDFGIDRGGFLATNDIRYGSLFRAEYENSEGRLGLLDKKLVAAALSQTQRIERFVSARILAVKQVYDVLSENAIPVVKTATAHCILIDVKQIDAFASLPHPVESFTACLYFNTGIRSAGNNIGMQHGTEIDNIVRLAFPIGLSEKVVRCLAEKLVTFFECLSNIPRLEVLEQEAPSLKTSARYSLVSLADADFNAYITDDAEKPDPQLVSDKSGPNLLQDEDRFKGATSALSGSFENNKVSSKKAIQDVAIVGLSGRYPGADNIFDLWKNLSDGKDSISDLPLDRVRNRSATKNYDVYKGGFIDSVDRFDSLFFNISPREAELLDPQERLFLECAWEALEDAGYYPELLTDESSKYAQVGVFVGAVWSMYQVLGAEQKIYGNSVTSNSFQWSIANRVSYWMNFSGPSLTIDTACSSSLTAMYYACEAIRKGDCNSAIVGGVNLDLHQHKIDINRAGGALSNDGTCKSFGKGANGYVAGEGIAAVYLKPLERAIKDYDNIHGVIRGIAINHGGRTNGYTVPSPRAQADLISKVLEEASIDPRTIGYIEAHGTGTELGDPIEIDALTKAFRICDPNVDSCSIGSIKTNIGHLEAAAGLAGVTKVLLQMRNRQLVPSLHSEELNEHIDFDATPFKVQQTLSEWKAKTLEGRQYPLRGAISSFGAGGSNAHMIIEQYQRPPTPIDAQKTHFIFPFSAKSANQLREFAKSYIVFLSHYEENSDAVSIKQIACTLQVGKKSFEHRLAIIASSLAELIEKLTLYLDGKRHPDILDNTVKQNTSISKFLSNDETEKFLHLLLEDGKPAKIAHMWIEGVIDNFQFAKKELDTHKISVPTYPFAKKKHWIETKFHRVIVHEKLHPLVDSNISTFTQQLFKKTFRITDFFIYDHLVSTIPTLPGVAYLDMARASAELAASRPVAKIYNVIWVSPLVVNNDTDTQAIIELVPKGETIQFEVFSLAKNHEKILCCQGKIVYADDSINEKVDEYIDFHSVKKKSNYAVSGVDAYPIFKNLGLDLGSSFQVLKEVYKTETEILGVLEIPECREPDFADYLLHPSLMDGALQAGMAASIGEEGGEMFVPYSIGSVEILHPLAGKCYSYIRREITDGSKLAKANVFIVDESGKILVKIRDSIGVPLGSVHHKNAGLPDDYGFETRYYSYAWREEKLIRHDDKNAIGVLVVFAEPEMQNDFFDQIDYFSGDTVYFVQSGSQNKRIAENIFEIDRTTPTGFSWLLTCFDQSGIKVENIWYAWPIHDENDDQALNLNVGYYAFHFFCQSVILHGIKHAKIVYAYRALADVRQAAYESINGYVHTLHAESPNLQVKVVEFGEEWIVDTRYIGQLYIEMRDPYFNTNQTVSHKFDVRSVRRVSEFNFIAGSDHVPIKEQGVYIITGGLGGLGFLFAKHLSKSYRASLLLTGRRQFDNSMKDKIADLEASGGRVCYFPCDVACHGDVAAMVQYCKNTFGRIDGVFHAAGIIKDGLIRNKMPEDIDNVLRSKVNGSLNLDAAISNEAIDFFVAFSSMAAVGGNLGQSDYAYANHFMDTFCRYRNARVRNGLCFGKSISINWSIWAEGGMQLDRDTEEYFKKKLGIRPLRSSIGFDALSLGLNSGSENFVVVDAKKEILEKAWHISQKEIYSQEKPVSSGRIADKIVDLSQANSESEKYIIVRQSLSHMVKGFLKLSEEELDTEALLLDLGFDSIGLASFANKINDEFSLDITPVMFFEYPNIDKLSEYINSQSENSSSSYGVVSSGDNSKVIDSGRVSHSTHSINKGYILNNIKSTPPETSEQVVEFSKVRFQNMPVVIVGMSGVMPQSDNLSEYWENLINATDNMVTVVPSDRWCWEDYYGDPLEEENKTKVKWGGFMREIDKFDPLFFGISPREAEMMDPQQRIFLQTVCGAIEDSGHKLSDLAGTRTGLFVGASTREYLDLMGASDMRLDGYSASGTSHAILANRVSYLLDLRGPSAPIDTACSSSLVALHRAIESIHTGSCEMAIVGGVQVMLTPAGFISFSAAGMLADDGRCKTFDEKANGYVRGEGAGAILIKTLSKAKEDGDRIYAIVRATAENHGGKATMLTAPNRKAQTDVVLEAYEKAGVNPKSVGFIECHGTGTSLGDPIEVEALKAAFDLLYKQHGIKKCEPHIGLTSAKTNIGHLEAAAGIAGLLKVLLSIKYKKIPPLLHFNKLNSYIEITDSPFYIVDTPKEWGRNKSDEGVDLPRCAGLSSFGFGGANVHVVLEEYYEDLPSIQLNPENDLFLFVLSARNQESLREYAKSIGLFLKNNEVRIDELAYTSQVGRDAYESRLAIVTDSTHDLANKLTKYLAGEINTKGLYTGDIKKSGIANISEEETLSLIQSNMLSKLAQLWCQGEYIGWSASYRNTALKRVNLPSYPFAKDRYWFCTAGQSADYSFGENHKYLHPLVHQNVSSVDHLEYISYAAALRNYLDGHQENTIKKMGQLVPAELIEIAIFTCLCAHQEPVNSGVEITGVTFHKGSYEDYVVTQLYQQDGDSSGGMLSFSINSLDEEKQSKTLCSGISKLVSPSYPAQLDLEYINKKIDQTLVINDYFDAVRTADARNSWNEQAIFKGLKYKDEQMLLVLNEINGEIDEHEKRILFLRIMIKLVKVAYIKSHKAAPDAIKIIGIDSIRMQPNSKRARFVWLYPSQSHQRVSDSLQDASTKYDLVFCDSVGNICMRVHSVSIEAHGEQSNSGLSLAKNNLLLLNPQWKVTDLDNINYAARIQKNVDLILMVDVSHELRSGIEHFFSSSEIRHFPIEKDVQVSEQFDRSLACIFESVKSMISDSVNNNIHVLLILGQQVSSAISYAYLGLFKSLCAEDGRLACEIHQVEKMHNVSATIKSIGSNVFNGDCSITRHSSGGVMRLTWTPLTTPQSNQRERIFADNKNYVVTGGLGKIGRFIVRGILETTINTRVLITSRKDVDEALVNEYFGDNSPFVECCKLDLANAEGVKKEIDKFTELHGAINGVFHVAGQNDDGLFVGKTFDEFLLTLEPKVTGLCNLDAATQSHPLDFMVLFSSVVSVFGNVGQADYAAANGFMDGFALERNRLVKNNERSGRCISINWPLWEEGGLEMRDNAKQLLFEMTGMNPFPSDMALEVISCFLCSDSDQGLVLYGDIEKTINATGLDTTRDGSSSLFNSSADRTSKIRTLNLVDKEKRDDSLKQLLLAELECVE